MYKMSVNPPPSPNVNRFNNLYWISADDGLTIGVGDLRYLKFPNAQGTETLLTTNVNGTLTSNSQTIQADTANVVSSRIKQNNTDLTIQAGYNKPNTTISISCNNATSVSTPILTGTYGTITTGGQQFTFNSVYPPLTNQTSPPFTDYTNQMTTTYWINGAINLYGGFQQALIYKDKDYDYIDITLKTLQSVFGFGLSTGAFSGSLNNSVIGVTTANGADIYLNQPVGGSLGVSYSFTGATYNPLSINFSADGHYGLITNDSGGVNSCEVFIWNGEDIQSSSAPINFWIDSALSANGQFMLLAPNDGSTAMFVSKDYGVTFTATGSIAPFFNCAISATGQYMIATAQNDNIYISRNFGVSWKPAIGGYAWYNCCMSANGQYMIVQANNYGGADVAYASNDYGVTWTLIATKAWTCCCMTDNGRFQVAFYSGGNYDISLNFGKTWTGSFAGLAFDTGTKPKFTNDDKYIVGLVGGTPQYIIFNNLW